ncbi:MAG TPA: pentapeptide repeat-containing protein [Xanthobacteraceae bacterium]|jgi:uncharacterized protein YjbI with pentapeptide repeats|nr:pentapeptide repeat-containing protein [Xanthobacteraceae bacterium]
MLETIRPFFYARAGVAIVVLSAIVVSEIGWARHPLDLNHADLSGQSLAGEDLQGVDLTFADLTGANLAGANLASANLTGSHLTFANLTGAKLDEACGDANTKVPDGLALLKPCRVP